MLGPGPLEDLRLQLLRSALDSGALREARSLLARLPQVPELVAPRAYFLARLEYQEGRLSPGAFLQRLGAEVPALLQYPEVQERVREARARLHRQPEIPKAPAVPAFATPRGLGVGPPRHGSRGAEETPSQPPLTSPAGPPAGFSGSEVPMASGISADARRIRSGPPPALGGSASSLLEVLELLDHGKARQAQAALLDLDGAPTPERALLVARAHVALDEPEAALRVLARLTEAPLLEPEVRAGAARALRELGHLEAALTQARLAFTEDPEQAFVRLVLAQVLVSCARQGGATALYDEADELLQGLRSRHAPQPGLVLALRALLLAELGDAQRGLELAQRALALEPRSAEALSALGLASLRLGRQRHARRAWSRLRAVDGREALALMSRLESSGVATSSAARVSAARTIDAAALWAPVEQLLVAGHREEALAAVEAWLEQHRDRLSVLEPPAVAALAQELFARAPVLSSFAPYDGSLWSLARLAAGLGLLQGREPRSELGTPLPLLLELAAAYVGQALVVAHAGRWVDASLGLEAARVVTAERAFSPAQGLLTLRGAGSLGALEAAFAASQPRPETDAWQVASAAAAPPAPPWAPRIWPPVSDLEPVAAALSRSILSHWASDCAEGPLDRSIVSLGSLDRYLSLVAPLGAPAQGHPDWVRQTSLLAGAYLGEVLRDALSGAWELDPAVQPMGLKSYVLRTHGVALRPMTVIEAWLCGQSPLPSASYAARVLKQLR